MAFISHKGQMKITNFKGFLIRTLFERGKASASALQVEVWFVCFIIPGSLVIRPKESIEDLPKANSRLDKSKGGGGGKPSWNWLSGSMGGKQEGLLVLFNFFPKFLFPLPRSWTKVPLVLFHCGCRVSNWYQYRREKGTFS